MEPRFGDATTQDGELIRLLDGELADSAGSALRARVAADVASAGRLDELQHRSRALTGLLEAAALTDQEVAAAATLTRKGISGRRRRRMRRMVMVRAAAAITVLVALGTVVPPVRAWFADIALRAADALRPPPVSHSTGPGVADVRVRFPVSGGSFRLVLEDPAGTLTIWSASDSMGAAELMHAGDAQLLITADGLTVTGTLPERAGIVLALPTSVQEIVISHGMQNVVVALPAAGVATRLDLVRLLR